MAFTCTLTGFPSKIAGAHFTSVLNKRPVNVSPVLGSIKFSFIVDKEGYFSNLKYADDLYHRQIAPIITGQMFPGRLFSTEVKWAPAILDGKPVSVQVKAIIDYDSNEFSWDCFVLDEE